MHHRIIMLATVVLALVAFIAYVPHTIAKPTKPLPDCQAKVAELEATIEELKAQIVTLNASLKYKLPKTGQKYVERPGDDGDLQMGMAWPEPRFYDNGDGTVTDNMTNLVWLKDANYFGVKGTWYDALTWCNDMLLGDWRLPNVLELLSLVDFNYYYPREPHGSLPEGHPFINPIEGYYWTSTTASDNFGSGAFSMEMWTMGGDVSKHGKNEYGRVWCVRDLK